MYENFLTKFLFTIISYFYENFTLCKFAAIQYGFVYVCMFVCVSTVVLCLEHSNFFGVDDTFGPIAISLRRERMDDDIPPVTMAAGSTETLQSKYLYRIIVRIAAR